MPSWLLSSFYEPYSMFSTVAQGMHCWKKDGSIVHQLSSPCVAEAIPAVACGNAAKVTDDAAQLKTYVNSIANLSIFSSLVWWWVNLRCRLLADLRPIPGIQRLAGDNFKGKLHCQQIYSSKPPMVGPVKGSTSFPLLLIGNTAGEFLSRCRAFSYQTFEQILWRLSLGMFLTIPHDCRAQIHFRAKKTAE